MDMMNSFLEWKSPFSAINQLIPILTDFHHCVQEISITYRFIHFTEERRLNWVHVILLNIIACTASIVYNSYERME